MRELDGTSRGFGFVTFEDDLSVSRAIQHYPHFICGHKVEVERYVSKRHG